MLKKSVITIGTFDGIHKGHQLLIKRTLSIAKKKKLRSVLIALEKPVKKVSGLLSTYKEKQEELRSFGLDEVYILKVPSDILHMSHDKFFDDFLVNTLKVDTIICGYDFAFGKNRRGDISWLTKKAKNNNVRLQIVKPLKISSKQISSSHIRKLIESGNVDKVLEFLGRFYSFTGKPFKDRGIATKLGYPTVNLEVSKEKLLPKGIYISAVCDGINIYASITNIGSRPTFSKDNKIVPETHILKFKGRWKKVPTKVILIKKIRSEKKFKSADILKQQIAKDITKAVKFFDRVPLK
ncbi:MAG: bifunctional riboflavin kinase/FAD synthetase [Endomicrobium sp.]|jgi:riboflavin kinase/FMN adenylyltransferase|uniref:bifunctional riboflavin kinase/FAD synthetase n=1 Tax=Candidatus Endomicrobiellum cubanum TaxID=3242325 RepID=UPI002819B79B|nr:bifunctional riboflavin kinase/FAD synthetase [Endomicrobium sp.]